MRICFGIVLTILFLNGVVEGANVRRPQVAGRYYPESSPILLNEVDRLIGNAKRVPLLGRMVAMIVPHAGYEFSGQVAAHAYKQLIGQRFDTIIIIGPSHHRRFRGVSVWESGVYQTPLGDVPIDSELAKAIILQDEKIFFDPDAHLKEHSLEVQLPFLQRSLKGFKIVPILMGEQSIQFCEILSDAIIKAIKGVGKKKRLLIIASTDLSRYYHYDKAKGIDNHTISIIKEMEPKRLLKELEKGRAEMCGGGPAAVAIMVAKELGADRIRLLKYMNSGDVTGERFRVVGYASFALYATDTLDKDAKKELLGIARRSIKEYLETGSPPSLKPISPFLRQERGAFVTLTKKGRLRGCIGYIYPVKPLYETVRDAAIKAATGDLRFKPLTKEELRDVKIEISVFSPLEKIDDPSIIKPGTHGLFITRGWQEGLLLPQVAKRYGWDQKRLLEETCKKAGLPKDAYKKGVNLYIFEAQVFCEE